MSIVTVEIHIVEYMGGTEVELWPRKILGTFANIRGAMEYNERVIKIANKLSDAATKKEPEPEPKPEPSAETTQEAIIELLEIEDTKVGVGDIREVEFGCPNCDGGESETDTAEILLKPGAKGVKAVRIVKIPAVCKKCTCVFTYVYGMEYIHSKVDIEASPPEEPEKPITVGESAKVHKQRVEGSQIDMSVTPVTPLG